jgi:hypothetical protein
MSVWGRGSPKGLLNRAVTANQSARAPTREASKKALKYRSTAASGQGTRVKTANPEAAKTRKIVPHRFGRGVGGLMEPV